MLSFNPIMEIVKAFHTKTERGGQEKRESGGGGGGGSFQSRQHQSSQQWFPWRLISQRCCRELDSIGIVDNPFYNRLSGD